MLDPIFRVRLKIERGEGGKGRGWGGGKGEERGGRAWEKIYPSCSCASTADSKVEEKRGGERGEGGRGERER